MMLVQADPRIQRPRNPNLGGQKAARPPVTHQVSWPGFRLLEFRNAGSLPSSWLRDTSNVNVQLLSTPPRPGTWDVCCRGNRVGRWLQQSRVVTAVTVDGCVLQRRSLASRYAGLAGNQFSHGKAAFQLLSNTV